MKIHHLYISIVLILFVALTIVFDTFPRSTVSELEKRSLAKFPEFTIDKLADGSFFKEVSSWFSDSEPYRDNLMALSMGVKDAIRVSFSDESISFHASEDTPLPAKKTTTDPEKFTADEYKNNINANEVAKIANAGIVVVGKGDNVRAFMVYGGGAQGGVGYANAANTYKRELGKDVNVYCMAIPTAMEFYCPDKVKPRTREERLTINNIYSHLNSDVKPVDVYTPLALHAKENIYLRTDHHWSPLGAFYAARKFANVAKVPFKNLKSYETHSVPDFVGTMYGYSKDIAVKNAPEVFVYYTPKGVTYETTHINYELNENYKVIKEYQPVNGEFFFKYKGGGAYFTFMGGDRKLVTVKTSTNNHRRLAIIKDSFGNALPGYMFFSFEEIHVIDFRYFNHSLKQYVKDNGITDVLICCNIFNAYSDNVAKKIENLLDNIHSADTSKKAKDNDKAAKKDGEDTKNNSKALKKADKELKQENKEVRKENHDSEEKEQTSEG